MLSAACLQDGKIPDVSVYNEILSALCAGGEHIAAEEVLRKMIKGGIGVTKESYRVLLRSYAERGMGEAAERLVRGVQEAGYGFDQADIKLVVEAFATISF